MEITIRVTSWGGLELTDQQMDDCRAYATAELIHYHRDEFEDALKRHVDAALNRIRDQIKSANE